MPDACFMILSMNIRFQLQRLGMVAAGLGFACLAEAQIQNPDGTVPRISDPNSSLMPWLVAVVFAVGILAVAFKNSKRSHLD